MMARPLLRLRGGLPPPGPGLGLGLGSSSSPAAGWHSGGAGRSSGRGPSAASSSPAGLYEVLGVPRSATQAQIKTAYYKQSFLLHPDRNAGSEEAAERFTRLHEAYLVLGSVGLRKKYDRGLLTREDLRTAGKPSSSSGAAASASPGAPKRRSAQAYAPSRPPSSGKPIFDFDAFYRAHYGQQLEREQEKRTKQQEKKKEQLARKSLKEERMHELVAILLLAATVSFFLRFL